MKKRIIIASKPGQLCNRLFQFCNFIAFANEHNLALSNPSFYDYMDLFENLNHNNTCSFPINPKLKKPKLYYISLYNLSYYIARILNRLNIKNKIFNHIYLDWTESCDLDNKKNLRLFDSHFTFIQGWEYICPELVRKHKDSFLHLFKPIQGYQSIIDKKMIDLRKNSELVIGIHIRQGDYKLFKNGIYYYPTSYYIQSMQKLTSIFSGKKIKFLICSNEKQTDKDFEPFDFNISNDHFIIDLYTLASCDYLFGPPSTFTMWASFYGNVPLLISESVDSTIDRKYFKIIT